MATINRPHGTTLAALKGLAITTSLLTAGQLGTITLTLPALYPAAQTSHRLAAQQFASLYRTAKATGVPVEILTTLICAGLAFVGYQDLRSGLRWKLWAGAAASMFAVIPWTHFLMEPPSAKLLWVSEVASSATTTRGPISTGIGVKVDEASPAPPTNRNSLGAPSPRGRGRGAITPMEEFEPFEDAVMDQTEYEQLKVVKLLKTFNGLNTVRVFGPLMAGGLGLWAALTE
ncbi:hypothetical protein LTR37_014438 [Vermiconidia calcicola]|uniref:Uncharacterized protein n=1 Tax=Vermiconidia calcicola TaxID=1690605 RepID=A0ACC3MTJ0_9PEZI|nr:hypothetical protein LTR37_014438 [Vermiconidia calcicola]